MADTTSEQMNTFVDGVQEEEGHNNDGSEESPTRGKDVTMTDAASSSLSSKEPAPELPQDPSMLKPPPSDQGNEPDKDREAKKDNDKKPAAAKTTKPTQEKTRKKRKHKRRRPAKKNKRKHDKLFQDVIRVEIPLNYTADLAIAIHHTRKKRILAFRDAYPELFPQPSSDGAASDTGDENQKDGDTTADDSAGNNNKADNDPPTIAKRNKNVPNRRSYASILDYLEAKYVKGVMIDQDGPESTQAGGGGAASHKNAENDDDDEEEKGSVYSESSFLDDTDLQRDVAEQVLASRTTTKLELAMDDSEFFVNVGNLEVEETEQTKEHYDPLKDVDEGAPKKAKPRKKPTPKAAPKSSPKAAPKKTEKETSGEANNPNKPSTAKANKPPNKPPGSKPPNKPVPAKREASSSGLPPKKKAKTAAAATAAAASDSKDTTSTGAAATEKATPPTSAAKKKKPATTSPQKKAERQKLLKVEAEKKAESDTTYAKVVSMIKALTEEELPRRKTKMKLSIACPAGKGPGDEVHFDNPNVPGQRLKVNIPKNVQSGGIFKVTIAIPNDADPDDDTDHNKWSREFYEVLSDYAYHYDQWMDAMTDRHKHAGTEFAGHFEKRKKFDKMIDEFPKDLKTPIDKAYLQKILRRARQNKHKRDKTAKRLEQRAQKEKAADNKDKAGTVVAGAKIKVEPKAGESPAAKPKPEAASKPPTPKVPPKPKRLVKLPFFSSTFPQQPWSEDHFQ